VLSHTEYPPLSFIFGFLKPNIPISSLDFDERRKDSELKEPQLEELKLVSKKKESRKKSSI
jgi:hypothetical protein